ncbi:hypothetical protein BACFRA24663_24075 [Bacteroides fragilis]
MRRIEILLVSGGFDSKLISNEHGNINGITMG